MDIEMPQGLDMVQKPPHLRLFLIVEELIARQTEGVINPVDASPITIAFPSLLGLPLSSAFCGPEILFKILRETATVHEDLAEARSREVREEERGTCCMSLGKEKISLS
jgi:hypothetical protein